VFDCTNDETVAMHHATWLRSGIDVVTANNTGLSGPKPVRQEIKEAEQALGKQSAKYLRQVTVAGGLPVLSTLRSLLNSGDVIRRIDGVFTVVLSYVLFRISPPPDIASCSNFDMEFSNGAFGGDLSPGSDSPGSTATIGTPCTLSEAIREAIALGLTEEDPTTDLNNEYTARVLMVLARELGMDDDNDVTTIQHSSDTLWDIGKTLGVASPRDLGQLLTPEMDQKVKDRVESAQSRGCVLRSISSIDVKSKRIEIKLVEVPTHHVFAVTPPSCSCVRFFTKRHRAYPLIIQGPSAGADSTASALLAELLQRTRGLSNTRTLALSREGSGAFLNRLLSPTSTAAPPVSA
jgi:homoserine dehydrogenase